MKKLERLNELVGAYAGQFANWRHKGGKGAMPPQLVEAMDELQQELEKVLVKKERA